MSQLIFSILIISGIGALFALLLELADHFIANYGECRISINQEKELVVKGGNPLLFSLMEEGIFIPSACGGKGTCAYCKVKVLDGGGPIKYVIIFSLVAFFILLIACINFMNLSTAQSAHRAREIGLRKVVGSDRFQIVKQFFSESILITVISVILAMILVMLFLPWFNNLSGKQLSTQSWNGSMILGLVAITLIAGFLSGSYPALILSSFSD